ncbi:Uncharacterised protein [Mycobacteroides abscessus subsp. abscessus]|nr:Uncharacterised protein [Mycobacteroides abscessus subsp. abscessus]SLC92105.1 Uncharacterised protein [Mycobacteroides abscessus subsp. massiliense]
MVTGNVFRPAAGKGLGGLGIDLGQLGLHGLGGGNVLG